MGVNVSQPLGGNKIKYIHPHNCEEDPRNFDENEEFLSESSKRKEAGLFQFKSRKCKSKCPLDSLDTIDSRKSVPFAALPVTTRASTSSPSGDNEDLHSIFSEVSTSVLSKNSRVLFTNEVPTEGMEQDGVFTERGFTEGFHKKTNQSSDLDQSLILRMKLFMCAQFRTIPIKDSLLEGKANLKCSYRRLVPKIF